MELSPGNPTTDLGQPASDYDHNLEHHRRNKLRGDAISDLIRSAAINHTNTYAAAFGVEMPLRRSEAWDRYYQAWLKVLDPAAAARFATEQEHELLLAQMEAGHFETQSTP